MGPCFRGDGGLLLCTSRDDLVQPLFEMFGS